MQFRPVRWFLALTLAAVLAALPLVGVQFLGGDLGKSIELAAFGFGTSWVTWLVGTAVLGTIAFRRGRAYPVAFTVLGALLAYLFPLANLFVVLDIVRPLMPAVNTSGPLTGQLAGAALAAGVFDIPFGLLGGWLFSRIAARPSKLVLSHAATQHCRRCQDVRRVRLIGALLLAGALPGGVLVIIGALLDDPASNPAFAFYPVASAMVVLEIWFLVLGLLYAFAVGLGSGHIRRRGCFLLGTLLTCFFPVFTVILGIVLHLPLGGDPPLAMFMMAVAAGIMLIPIGLLSGWILWRIGVRPAPPLDLSPVFD